MSKAENPQFGVPFRDTLVVAPFDKGYGDKSIKMLASDLDTIIRVDKDYSDFFVVKLPNAFTREQKHEQYLATRGVFDSLTNKYGMSVVRHDLVMGSNPDNPQQPIYYTVSERIDGPSLADKKFTSEEKPEAAKKLDKFYSSLATYVWDIHQNGGWVFDLFHEEAQNKQFAYGKKKDEAEDKVWLVDVDGKARYSPPLSEEILLYSIPTLIQMIQQSENKVDHQLTEARQTILDQMNSITNDDSRLLSAIWVRRELQDPTAGSKEQDEQVLQKTVNDFFDTPRDTGITKKDYARLVEDFFSSKDPLLAEIERQSERMRSGEAFNWRYYNANTRAHFQSDAVRMVVRRIYESGKLVFKPVENRHGWVTGYINKKITPMVRDALYSLPNDIYYVAKAESDKRVIEEQGWTQDIVTQFHGIYDAFIMNNVGRPYTDFREYYVKLATTQTGIEYPLPIKIDTVIEGFHRYASSRKKTPQFNFPNFRRFTTDAVREYVEESLTNKFTELAQKYGDKNVESLKDALIKEEIKRISLEAFSNKKK